MVFRVLTPASKARLGLKNHTQCLQVSEVEEGEHPCFAVEAPQGERIILLLQCFSPKAQNLHGFQQEQAVVTLHGPQTHPSDPLELLSDSYL